MSNIPISSLPLAISLDGSEFVPLVQGGTTKRATVADISTFPAAGGSFVMATLTPTLTGSRVLAPQAGVTTVTDGGPLGNITVGIATNGIGNTQLRQGTALSVIGNASNALANVADIVAASDFQVMRRSGTAIGFGSINLASSAAVGSSILQPVNGGTGVNNGSATLTLGGNLTTSGAFASTFTMTGATNVTFPTSGTLATTAGAALPAVAQGDLLYGSAPNVLSTLPKNTTASRYLANTGTTNNPQWDQVNLTNGVTGTLPATSGGTDNATYAVGDILYASTTTALSRLADIATGNVLLSGGVGVAPSYGKVSLTAAVSGILPLANGGTNANLTASNGGMFYSTASAGAILAGTATARQMLQSGATAAPAWSTAVWPATTAAGTILASATANTLTATSTPTLGVAGSLLGSLAFAGNTSGTVTVQPQAAAGTYNFNLPTTAGTSGQPLLSGGGAASPMTFGTLGVAGGGTGIATATAYAVLCGGTTATGPFQSIASVGTSGQVLTSNGAAALPTMQSISTALDTISSTRGNIIYRGAAGWAALANGAAGTVLSSNGVGADPSYISSGGTGTVTSVAAGTGLAASPSPITTSGTMSLATIATGKMLANTTGSTAVPSATDIPVIHLTTITATGTFTTPSNATTATVYKYRIVGGGGGGGGANGGGAVGGGGAGGAYAEGTFTGVAASTGISVTIGAAGASGSAAGGTGGNGGDTILGSPITVTAGGGSGGIGSTAAGASGTEGGNGGGITGSPSIGVSGKNGGRGWSISASVGVAGYGADNLLGFGGVGGSLNVAQLPRPASGYGSGGGGAFLTASAGGVGMPGVCIVEWVL